MLAPILRGTERTLDFAVTHGTQKFLLVSSGAVYGKQPPSITHLSEDYAGATNQLRCDSVYSEGKRAAELMCAVYGAKYGIECKIARLLRVVGPYLPLDAHFAIGNFIRDAKRGDLIHVNGDGTPSAPIFMRLISPSGFGRYCFERPLWRHSMLDRSGLSAS